MKMRYDIILGLGRYSSLERRSGKITPESVAKKMESVFLSEFLKVMLEQTSFGKERVFSTYMPVITSAVGDFLAERQTGISKLLLENPAFRELVEKSVEKQANSLFSFKNSPPSVEKNKK